MQRFHSTGNSKEVPLKQVTLIIALLVAGGAAPSADLLANYYGNTLIGMTVGGRTARASLSRDGTFVGTSPQGTAVKGRWKVENAQLCFTVAEPPPNQTQPVCVPLAPHKIGAKWTVNDGQRTWSVTLQTGT